METGSAYCFLMKSTEISVTGRGLSAGTPCHMTRKRQTTSLESFKEGAVVERTYTAKVRRNWDDWRHNTSDCRAGSLSKAQRKNLLPVQIMVTFRIVAHPCSATARNHGSAPGEEKNIMILPGIEALINSAVQPLAQ